MTEMPQTDYHLHHNNTLQTRMALRIPVVYAIALFKFAKSSRVQHLLHNLKYKNHPEIGVMLGKVYGTRLIDAGFSPEFDLILPVPLHESRKAKKEDIIKVQSLLKGFQKNYAFLPLTQY